MSCPNCNGTGWIEQERNGHTGAARCPCMRVREPGPAELTQRQKAELSAAATEGSEELGAIPDYPHGLEKAARQAVAEALMRMCSSPEEVRYVVRRAIALFRSWKLCAVPGLRQILCSKYRSRDGIESGAQCISDGYPEGIPSEEDGLTGYQLVEAGGIKALESPRGLAPSKDESLSIAVIDLAERKRLPPPIPPGKKITHAEIEAELQRKRVGK